MDSNEKQVRKDELAPVPPVPPRPNEQYTVPQRISPYGHTSHYGAANPYFGMVPPHLPYGMQMISNVDQRIDSTFQSIQSVVQAFSSITMMLESTYMAIHSSFRAVMDVADHFVRLKDSLSNVMSLVNILNTIKWFFRRLMYMFNMVSEDQIWTESLETAKKSLTKGQQSILEQGRGQSSWPMLMFLGVAIGAPYMIYQIQKPSATCTKWMTQEDSHYIGEALYNFNTDKEEEIPLVVGQKVIIAPKEQQPKVRDWLLATVDGKRSGLIPMNYVKIVRFEVVE